MQITCSGKGYGQRVGILRPLGNNRKIGSFWGGFALRSLSSPLPVVSVKLMTFLHFFFNSVLCLPLPEAVPLKLKLSPVNEVSLSLFKIFDLFTE